MNDRQKALCIESYRLAHSVVECAAYASFIPPNCDNSVNSPGDVASRAAHLEDSLDCLRESVKPETRQLFNAANPFPAQVGSYAGLSYLEVAEEYGEDVLSTAAASGLTSEPDEESMTRFFKELSARRFPAFDIGLLELHLYKECVRVIGDEQIEVPHRSTREPRSEVVRAAVNLLADARARGVAPDYGVIAQRTGASRKYVRSIASKYGFTP
ncbi:hypothetical protein KOR34_52320 [Posidoniimonas corsicana]|uniref:Uncharacterized protein n=1 Tax=Posidoniimonas corsicana TaxID=1938618 RepID=A0A5C5UV58_9BACT|nr:hypothetical protein [Posidoniimonas corsicana]TWT29322.1 hypothetical protein KOR34_52320 [Posidoniimonas corsicana]